MEKSCRTTEVGSSEPPLRCGTFDPTLAGSGFSGEPSAERNSGDGTNGYGRPEAMEPKFRDAYDVYDVYDVYFSKVRWFQRP